MIVALLLLLALVLFGLAAAKTSSPNVHLVAAGLAAATAAALVALYPFR